jgi:hypothetical protein
LHTYWVGDLRQVLDVQLNPGKQHTSVHAKAALERLLEELGDKRPALVRGDCGYGNEGILNVLEERDQRYLLRLRQTKNVQRLVARQFARLDWTRADEQGWQAVQDQLQLVGWTRARRVVIIRRRLREGLAMQSKRKGTQQLRLALADDAILDAAQLWEYTVLATDVGYTLEGVAQLYRDRCDVSGKAAAFFSSRDEFSTISRIDISERCKWKRTSAGIWIWTGGVRCWGASLRAARRSAGSVVARDFVPTAFVAGGQGWRRRARVLLGS